MSKDKGLLILFFICIAILTLAILNFFLPNILEKFRKETHIESEKISIRPEVVEGEDNLYSVDINMRTADDSGNVNKISAVSFSLTYPLDPNNKVEVTDIKLGNELTAQDWRVPVNKTTEDENGVHFEFAAVNINPEGFSSSIGTTLVTIYFRSEQELKDDAFILNFDNNNTVILSKTSPTKNIRAEKDLYYSVE